MKIIFRYSIITKEKFVIPNNTESLTFNSESEKEEARSRLKELQNAPFVANLEYKIEDVPTRRVVKARYAPKGPVYHFEVNFDVRRHQGLEVDDLDFPGRRKYVFAVDKDYIVTESELAKEFDIARLRPAYKAS